MRRTDALPDLRSETEIEGFRSDRIAKVIARAGLASRRDAEAMIAEGRVTVNGVMIESPALDVSMKDRITVDGEPLPARDRTRLWFYHKPRGLVTTARDPEGRDTVFDNLPEDLPRVIAVGRLDINTEGLLLLTNDGGLARVLELPATGWVRRYRVRAFGEVNQAQLDTLRDGLEIDGEQFGPVIATFERQQGANVWLTVDLREGKNREVKRVLEHLGLSVNRLIRISFGPFQLEDLPEGEAREIRSRVLKDQLGPSLMAEAGVDFESDRPASAMRERAAQERGGFDRGGPDRARSGGFGGETGRDTGDRSLPGERPGQRPYSKDEDATPRRRNSWRDGDTEKLVRRSGAPRRGQDPRMERAERAGKDGVVRARAGSITDPAGRKIKVERVTGPAAPEPARELRRPTRREQERSGERGGFAPEREADVMRDPSRRPNRERWKAEASEGEAPAREAAPRREWQERPPGAGRPYGDRPPRGDRPRGDRPPGDRPRGDRPQGDRPPRREWQDRPPRGDKAFGDRPPRGDRPQGDRPPRRDGPPGGERPYGDRPPRRDGAPGGKGGFGKGRFGGRPAGGRPGGKPGGRPSGGGKPRGRG
jgi:23S rRNA pseudouridine2605 synthase